eukprot:TRINITY_DN5485_c0_g2_i1.p1 TRINITY_DN5485_c0_g2~~TRINITY_DN5485_c0_g2_i1.p1  ORF type:complete len:1724 (+),score=575.60 TRINITY_DN5485_c0_g2_i1:408-5174(+)
MVSVPGGKPMKLGIKGRADVPSVNLKQDSFDFGAVYIGTSARLPITLSNTSSLAAMVILDLHQFEEFNLEKDVSITDETVVFDENQWKIHLEPEKDLTLSLVYKPTTLANHNFQLPLHINGVDDDSLWKTVTAESGTPPLTLSHQIIDFGNQVVLKEGFKSQPYHISTVLSNDTAQTLSWELDMSTDIDFPMGTFVLEPGKGVLEKGQKASVRVSFSPKERRPYQQKVSLCLDKTKKVYLEFVMQGVGIYPMLQFDTKEVTIPVVALESTSEATFNIYNKGYEHLQIRHRIETDVDMVPLKIQFPEGSTVSTRKDVIPVKVSFSSSRPICFTVRIEFFDNDSQKFPIFVSGATDNSLLTLFPFLDSSKKRPKTATELYDSDTTGKKIDPLVWINLVDNHDKDVHCLELVSSKNVRNLVGWLNSNLLKNPIVEFPTDVIGNSGRQIIEMVELLSGKKLQTSFNTQGASKKEDRIPQLIKRYDALLNALRAAGGIMGSIRSTFLLSANDYVKDQNMTMVNRPVFERNFSRVSIYSWSVVMYQIIKIFFLSRVNVRSYKTLPGMGNVKQDYNLPKSNTLSQSELLILKWLNFHYKKVHPTNYKKVNNLDDDLSDGVVIGAVISSHAPHLDKLGVVYHNCTDKQQLIHNVESVINALAELKLSYNITVKDFLEPHSADMLIFCLYLYQQLPQFIPKGVIEFHGALQETVIKELELSNPSPHALSYFVTLEGSLDFSVENSTVHLEPKSFKNFSISFMSRFSKNSEAKLTFFAPHRKGAGHFQGEFMVFILKSVVAAHVPIKTYQLKGQLYEPQDVSIDVINPLGGPGKFQIQLEQHVTLPVGKDGKPIVANQDQDVIPDGFVNSYRSINLNSNEKSAITLHFTPLVMGNHVAKLLFIDEKVGEFVIQVEVSVSWPAATDTVSWSCGDGETQEKSILIPATNVRRQQALAVLAKVEGESGEISKKTSNLNLQEPAVFQVNFSSAAFKGPSELASKSEKSSKKSPLESKSNDVLSKPMDTSTKSIDSASKSNDASKPIDNSGRSLHVEFHPSEPGTTSARMFLYSIFDVRVIQLEGVCTAKQRSQNIEVVVNARKNITKNIPIMNPTGKDWNFKVNLNGKYFSGPSEFSVASHKTAYYCLTFAPIIRGNFTGTLALSTYPMGEFIFNLKGVSEDPLPEDTLTIQTKAKQRTFLEIPVKNQSTSATTFQVFTDIPSIVGKSTITVAALENFKYQIALCPLVSGNHSGNISFSSKEGQVLFFNLKIDVERSPAEREISLESTVRKAVCLEITVENPLKIPVTFDVESSSTDLYFEPSLTLQPEESRIFQATYFPFLPGTTVGNLSFFNEKLGEFWYQLEMTAAPNLPEELPVLECSLGDTISQEIVLDNPLETPAVMKLSQSNLLNFKLNIPGNRCTIPPLGSLTIPIEFTPTSEDPQTCQITLSHAILGTYEYICHGRGRIGPRQPIEILCPVGEEQNQNVMFVNPFPETTQFLAEISGDFLTLEINTFTLEFLEEVEIPVKFAPTIPGKFDALVTVRTDEVGLEIPIVGRTLEMSEMEETLQDETSQLDANEGEPSSEKEIPQEEMPQEQESIV